MRTALVFFLCFCFLVPLGAQNDFANRKKQLDSLMRAHLVFDGKRPVPNFVLYARNAQTGFTINHGIGIIGRNETLIDSAYQYNSASITKTYVATVILQLMEESKLNLQDPMGDYLSDLEFLRYDELLLYEGENLADSVTIEMLLSHTSGIADVFIDADLRFNLSVFLHKKRQYTPQRFFKRYFKYNLHKKPASRPGAGYHYSDINYMLLGFIIEQVTGQDLPAVLRSRIIEPLGMDLTYFEHYEPPHTEGKRIDAYLNKINITKKINTSYEWGGGGMVSTTEQMGRFIEGLFAGKFFASPATLERMLDTSQSNAHGGHYGLGIFEYSLNDNQCYGHGGFYGSFLAYCPAAEVTISANIGQSNPPYNTSALIDEVARLVMQEAGPNGTGINGMK